MNENKTQAAAPAEKRDFGTALTRVNDTFMPLIMSQMSKSDIQMSPYAKECTLHAISAINAVLDKAGITWADKQLDKSTVSDILLKIACFQLNASASPREVYFQTRNQKSKDANGKDIWKKQIEMGIEGDGNDAILSRFGRDVKRVCQIWKVRENDEFEYQSFNGLDMTPPKWTPKGTGKIVKIVYPVIMEGHDGNAYTDFYIAEREDVLHNLLAHINNNLMLETFGIAESKYKATPKQKSEIEAKKREILNKARDLGLDGALDSEELQPYISPAWTEFQSREAMIERKMRNNAIKKIPKDFANGALETMFEETTDETYRATAREIAAHANQEPIDIDVDETTGEVIEPTTEEDTAQNTDTFPDKPQEPAKEQVQQTTPPTTQKPPKTKKAPF